MLKKKLGLNIFLYNVIFFYIFKKVDWLINKVVGFFLIFWYNLFLLINDFLVK